MTRAPSSSSDLPTAQATLRLLATPKTRKFFPSSARKLMARPPATFQATEKSTVRTRVSPRFIAPDMA